MEQSRDIKYLLTNYYMPYAKGVILSRAIPEIDGLKPSNRRILYTLYKMGGLTGNKHKSAKVVGQTMAYHPHGDSSIYDTMVRMSTGNGSLITPYVESKGNFGKAWSTMAYAASRYTEVKLAPICNEVFSGINENAVDMVANFDNTEVEPSLLPVKFPSILVNTSSGIAVGKASNIPSFPLDDTCNATIALLRGEVEDSNQLMRIIGAPDLPTGGYIHVDESEIYKLGETGRGTFQISGLVELYSDKIVIKEVPFNTTIEDIINDIKSKMKDELKEVASAKDLSGLNGLSATITLKRGSNSKDVLNKIYRLTKLRSKIAYNTSVVVDGRCRQLGIKELLEKWIEFRLSTLKRVYEYRLKEQLKEEYKLEIWEKTKGRLVEVVDIITNNTEADAKVLLVNKFSLTDEQADILLDIKLRLITSDRALKELDKLNKVRDTIDNYKEIIENDDKKREIIISELQEIIQKYGTKRKCSMVKPVVEEKKEVEVNDEPVHIVITESLKIKRLVSTKDIVNFEENNTEKILYRIASSNAQCILLFTANGTCYKIKVADIDASKGLAKEYVYSLINNIDDKSNIIYACTSGDYSGHFSIVYGNGRGRVVYLGRVSGNRSKYKNIYDGDSELTDRNVTTHDKFFMITCSRKAAYADLSFGIAFGMRSAFKVGRIGSDDEFFGLQPIENVPNFDGIDLDRYTKGYCVKIRDRLWE